jgi:putative ABC transport system permease protein
VNGFSQVQIGGVIFGESAVVSVAGAVTGLLVGSCFLYALKLIPALDGYVDPTMHPLLMLIVLALALLTGIAGAVYPAAFAMRIRAVEALRFE